MTLFSTGSFIKRDTYNLQVHVINNNESLRAHGKLSLIAHT